jgi:hypothetical protein
MRSGPKVVALFAVAGVVGAASVIFDSTEERRR